MLLPAFLFIGLVGLAQNTSHFHLAGLVSAYVTELRSKGVDTVCIYEVYAFGDEYPLPDAADSCRYENVYVSTYLSWKLNGKTFLTKKDNCFDYSVIEITSLDFWGGYFANRKIIKTEKVKEFEYISYDKKQKKKVVSELSYEHSINHDFKVITGNDTTAMKVDLLTMQRKSIDKGENLNYQYNNNLKSKQFIDHISGIIDDLQKRKSLIKTRR